MSETPETPTPPAGLIYQKIPSVMAEIDAIGKNRKGEMNYHFRGIDDVLNALKPVFSKHRIFVLPWVVSNAREDRLSKSGTKQIYTVMTVEFTLYAEDGSFVKARMIGEAQDTQDKSSNKAMSAAFKYMAFQVFCIPTDDPKVDTEAEGEDLGDGKTQPPKTTAKNGPKPGPTAKGGKATKPPVVPKHLTPAQLKRLYAILGGKKWPKDDVKRYLKVAFGVESSTDLTKAQYDQFVGIAENTTHETAMAEINAMSGEPVGDHNPNFADDAPHPSEAARKGAGY